MFIKLLYLNDWLMNGIWIEIIWTNKMTMKKLYSSFIATSAMTLFSYVFSILSGTNLREPHILTQLTKQNFCPGRVKRKIFLRVGWSITRLAYCFPKCIYCFGKILRSIVKRKRALFMVDGWSGGYLIWKFTLSAHPFPLPLISDYFHSICFWVTWHLELFQHLLPVDLKHPSCLMSLTMLQQ